MSNYLPDVERITFYRCKSCQRVYGDLKQAKECCALPKPPRRAKSEKPIKVKTESETRRRVRELYSDGLTQIEIARELNYSRQRIEQIFRKLGLDTNRDRTCQYCGKTFIGKYAKFCSESCAHSHSYYSNHKGYSEKTKLTIRQNRLKEEGLRFCSKCQKVKTLENFSIANSVTKYRHTQCRECANRAAAFYYQQRRKAQAHA